MFFSEKKNLGIFFTCGRKIWGAGACAAHYENVCDVRAGAEEKSEHNKGLMISPNFVSHIHFCPLRLPILPRVFTTTYYIFNY